MPSRPEKPRDMGCEWHYSSNSLHSPASGCAQEQTLLYLSGRLGKKITFCAIKSLMLNGSCSNLASD